MKKMIPIWMAILVILNLSACSPSTPNQPAIKDSVTPSMAAKPLPSDTLTAYPQVNASYPAPNTSSSNEVSGAYPVSPSIIAAKPPEEAPQPKSGKASISGVLVTLPTLSALPKTLFYFTLAVGEQKTAVPPLLAGPNQSKGDIAAYTDDNGVFSLDNIPPGNYYLVVSFPNALPIAQKSAEDDQPLFITLQEGQRLALGMVYIPQN